MASPSCMGGPAQDVTDKRARILASSIKQFLAEWDKASDDMLKARSTQPAHKQPAKGQQKGGNKRGPPAAAAAAAAQGNKKKAVPKNPLDEAAAKLLQELDDKINKSKRCKLEDIYCAVANLDNQQQDALASILAVHSTRLLPEKQVNEASLAIRDCLCAAAAAHSYRRPTTPDASCSSAVAFRQRGLPPPCALAAGFTAGQLLRAGYSTAELVTSGVPLDKLRAAGVSVQELYQHLPAEDAAQLSGVDGAMWLRSAGYTAAAVREGAAASTFSTWDLMLAGYPVPESTSPGKGSLGPGAQSPRNMGSHTAGISSQQQQQQQQAHVVYQLNKPLSPRQAQQQQQQQGNSTSPVALSPQDLQYFRHQIIPLMQMKQEQHVPLLLLGTKGRPVQSNLQGADRRPAAPMRSTSTRFKASQRMKWPKAVE